MVDKTWKARERRVAKRFKGGKRLPNDGSRAAADVETPVIVAQCKHGYKQPSYLKEWLNGIRATAATKGKVGVVIWSRKFERQRNALVILAQADFEALFGTLKGASDGEEREGQEGE